MAIAHLLQARAERTGIQRLWGLAGGGGGGSGSDRWAGGGTNEASL
jgi:hypothetical protein